jgi:hypothetical protein
VAPFVGVGPDGSVELNLEAGEAAECGVNFASVCASNGASCTDSASCCSNRCESATCLPSGACTAPGSTCMVRSTCCSGRCEPAGSNLTCLAYCVPDGAHCDHAQDCCSLACHASACGGALCAIAGAACAQDEQCCSGSCINGSCALDSSLLCRASGEGCTGGDSGISCCSGVCNLATGRCDPGPGACREPGALCMVNADCCRGLCMAGASGVPVCTAPCLADGADCNSAGDCCSGACGDSPSKCLNRAPPCGD